MGKYDDLTREETKALLNKIGGTEVTRKVLRGKKKIIVQDIARQQPPLVGTIVKTLTLKPFRAESVADAIRQGRYNYVHFKIVRLFTSNEVNITTEVKVDLVGFDRDWSNEDVSVWAKANGGKKPILPKHIYAIGIQHPEEQRHARIVGHGSVRAGNILCLRGDSGWRILDRYPVSYDWGRDCLVGFLHK